MKRRKLLIALATAGAFSAGFAVAVIPASAEPRTITVTLLGGKTVKLTVDVPPGTPLDQIRIPNLQLPIIGISEEEQPAQGSPEQPGTQDPAGRPESGAADDEKSKRKRKRSKAGENEAGGFFEEVETRTRKRTRLRGADGRPTADNPTLSLALPGPAPIGVPNFFIEKFRIPPFLLSIYQAAGIEYGVPWQVLAAINEIETDYGRNLNISSAGAMGWMQFIPSSWKAYGVDANGDGRKDPYNPVDAIFAAGRYLRAAGASKDLSRAIFAYNRADWYVKSVLMRAKLIGGLPDALVGSLTGLTQGYFPVAARARYANDLDEREATKRARPGQNPAQAIESGLRNGIKIWAKRGAPAVAVNDGRVVKIAKSRRLGNYVVLQDVYGNRYTYGRLAKVAERYPAPKPKTVSRAEILRELDLPRRQAKATAAAPRQAASAGRQAPARRAAVKRAAAPAKERLFANPSRPNSKRAGGDGQLLSSGKTTFKTYLTRAFGLDRKDVVLKDLKRGSRVIAGTILGRLGETVEGQASHLLFEIRPAGRGAPKIDPKPVLDGWKLLESTAIYRAAGKNPFFGPDAKNPTIGQILLMGKETLQRRVLANPRIGIYDCGRRDVEAGQIDRRVLATLEFLAASGLKPTVTSLRCGHSYLTKGGRVSQHSSGNAVDIAAINGVPILGNQGKGSITEIAVRRLLTLQGTMKPAQIITLNTYKGTDNTLAMADHDDHIHAGWQPLYGSNKKLSRQLNAVLKPGQWLKLIDRISEIDNPAVARRPSKYALKARRASSVPKGD